MMNEINIISNDNIFSTKNEESLASKHEELRHRVSTLNCALIRETQETNKYKKEFFRLSARAQYDLKEALECPGCFQQIYSPNKVTPNYYLKTLIKIFYIALLL